MKKEQNYSSNFEVVELGEQDVYVYDIEVEDIHNFFANDILVHNSVYLCLDNLVNHVLPNETDKLKVAEFLSKVCSQKLQKVIDEACKDFTDYFNHPNPALYMNRENIASSAIWTGKKRYAMNCLDIEGQIFPTGKTKVTGIEVVRSSTPKLCQKALKTALELLLNGTEPEFRKFCKDFKKDFEQLTPEQIAKPTGIDGMIKYAPLKNGKWATSTPIHVRASHQFNKKIKELTLEQKYGIITDGDKVKYLFLKTPNPTHENVIAFKETLPPEFKLHNYIDYELNYEKNFLDVILKIAELMGWKYKDGPSVSKFFA